MSSRSASGDTGPFANLLLDKAYGRRMRLRDADAIRSHAPRFLHQKRALAWLGALLGGIGIRRHEASPFLCGVRGSSTPGL